MLLIVFGTLFGIWLVGTAGSGLVASRNAALARAAQGPGASPAASARWVEISTLLTEYRDNEVRADSNFKNTWIQTSGYVNDVSRDFLSNAIFVTLGTGQRYELPRVQCFFPESEAKKAATLSKGSRVVVRGRVEGLMMNVLVRRCEFVGL